MRGALPHPSPHPSTPVTRRAFGAPVGEGSIQWPTREEQRGLRSPSPKCERAWGVETTRQGLAWLREPAAERADAGWPVTGRSLQRHTQWVARQPGGPKLSCPFSPNRLCPARCCPGILLVRCPETKPSQPHGRPCPERPPGAAKCRHHQAAAATRVAAAGPRSRLPTCTPWPSGTFAGPLAPSPSGFPGPWHLSL